MLKYGFTVPRFYGSGSDICWKASFAYWSAAYLAAWARRLPGEGRLGDFCRRRLSAHRLFFKTRDCGVFRIVKTACLEGMLHWGNAYDNS